jgi:hypothetical protein
LKPPGLRSEYIVHSAERGGTHLAFRQLLNSRFDVADLIGIQSKATEYVLGKFRTEA